MAEDPGASPESGVELYPRLFWEVFGIGLALALLVGLGVLLVMDGAAPAEWLLAAFGAPVFGAVTVTIFRRLRNPFPPLEVRPEGLLDRLTLSGTELFVAWEDVVDVEPGSYGGLRLYVRDPERYLCEVGLLQRLLLRGVLWGNGTPFLLPGDLFTSEGQYLRREELEELITARIDRRLVEAVRNGKARLEPGERADRGG